MIKQIIQDIEAEFGENTVPALLDYYGYKPKSGETPEDAIEKAVIERLYSDFANRVANYEANTEIEQRQQVAEQKLEAAKKRGQGRGRSDS